MIKPTHEVRLSSGAAKDLQELGPWKERTIRELLRLKTDPLAGHTLKGDLKGLRSLEFSLPGGAYRAIYAVKHNVCVCLVIIIGPHENIYEKAARRVAALRKAGEL